MSKKQRPSVRGRGDFLRPESGQSPTSTATPGEKSRNPESAKSGLMKVGVQVDRDLYFEIKKRAATERRKVYQLLNDAMRRYLGGD